MPSLDKAVGYGSLASKLALDNELRVFRHFAHLNLRNILYLQSELQELELKLQRLDEEANDSPDEPAKWSKPRSYHYAHRSKGTAPDIDDIYWSTVLRIREVLGQYNKALQEEAWLQKLKTPSKRSWSTVHQFISTNKTLISEADARYIAAENRNDLVQLTWSEKEAIGFLMEKYLRRFFKKKDNRFEDQTIGFISDKKITQVVRLLVISLSSVLPILSIVVLYVIKHTAVRLGVIIIFSVLCSLTLATLTNARNVEILGTTAAFAAVQVVFVSGNLTSF